MLLCRTIAAASVEPAAGSTVLTPGTRRWSARLAAAAATAAAVVVTLLPAPAQAATCSWTTPAPTGVSCSTSYSSGYKVTTIRSGTGTVLRAAFYDSAFFYSGHRILYYGSSTCSATTTDTDFRLKSLPDGWSNSISSVQDFSGCDVNLFDGVDFSGGSTGYVNYGGGQHLILKSNWASSFKVS